MNLETLINDDYKSIYLSHTAEIIKGCEKIFALYPTLQEITMNGSIRVNGALFNSANSVHVSSMAETYGGRVENKYQYYALIEDKDKTTLTIKSLIDGNASLFKAFTLITQNPYYKQMTHTAPHNERHTLVKKDFIESVAKVFGVAAREYYTSITEKNALEQALPQNTAERAAENATSPSSVRPVLKL